MNNAIFFAFPCLWDFVKKQSMDRMMLDVHIFLIQIWAHNNLINL
jgi:hypothetical protein